MPRHNFNHVPVPAGSLFKAQIDHLDVINKNMDHTTSNLINPSLLAVSIANKDTMHCIKKSHDHQDLKNAIVKEVKDPTNHIS